MWKKLIEILAKTALSWAMNALFKAVDDNKDGRISKEEAYNWVVDLLDKFYKKKS